MKNQVLQYSKGEVMQGETKLTTKKSYKKVSTGTQDYIGRAIDAFLSGEVGKFDKYLAVKNALVYRTLSNHNGKSRVRQNIIALRLESGEVIGNSSILELIGRNVSFGRESLNRSIVEVQTRISQLITMIPFGVFIEANLNLNKFKVLARGSEESILRKIPNPKYNDYDAKAKNLPKFLEETVHFTGASLFDVDGKIFLFDIDRREVEHKIFNPFLVEIPKQVSTIEDAYQSLKPIEVLEAEAKGLKVLRQGEWFFVPVSGEFEAMRDPNRWDKKEFVPLTLRAGMNRPNSVSKYSVIDGGAGGHVVSGYVEHSGREHAKLILNGWFKAIPNTSTRSFTITGDVD